MAGSAFRVRAYGAEPGQFYDEKDVHLWTPLDLLKTDNPQADWLAGWGNGKLYLAVWNQSFHDEQVRVDLNPDRVGWKAAPVSYRVWVDNEKHANGTMRDGVLEFSLPAKGLVAFAIDGVTAKTWLQSAMFSDKGPALGPGSIGSVQADFGKVQGMLISMGAGLTNAFVYTDALPENVNRVTFRYRQGDGEWKTHEDAIFPYELSVPVDEQAGDWECVVEARMSDLRILSSPALRLAFD